MSDKREQQKELTRSLGRALTTLGYTGPVSLPHDLSKREKLRAFITAVNETLDPSHFISTEENAVFGQLQARGSVLSGEQLQQAAARVTQEHSSSELDSEIQELRLKIASARSRLSKLTAVKKNLSGCYGEVVVSRDKLEGEKSSCQRRLQTALDNAQQANTQVNSDSRELAGTVGQVISFHQGEGKSLISRQSQDDYNTAEHNYLSQLTAYSKKQFFEGMLSMGNMADYQCSDVDLGNRDQLLLRGLSPQQYTAHCRELARLQAMYMSTETYLLNARMAESYAVSANIRAQDLITTGQFLDKDVNTLKHQVSVRSARVSELQAQLVEVSTAVLPGLLQDMALLKVSPVLHGDHDLKIARQDYFISKQQKVIDGLQTQRGRYELLSMLYEVELRRHRETHRLLSATNKQLSDWQANREKRIQALSSDSLKPVTVPRLTIDSGDQFSQAVCSVLGLSPSLEAPFITIEAVSSSLSELACKVSTGKNIMETKRREQSCLTQKQNDLLDRVISHFGEPGGNSIPLTPSEYTRDNKELLTVVSTMENNIKTLLRKFDGHRKTIKSDSALVNERQLFVYFFTEHSKLQELMGNLSKQIDNLAS